MVDRVGRLWELECLAGSGSLNSVFVGTFFGHRFGLVLQQARGTFGICAAGVRTVLLDDIR